MNLIDRYVATCIKGNNSAFFFSAIILEIKQAILIFKKFINRAAFNVILDYLKAL